MELDYKRLKEKLDQLNSKKGFGGGGKFVKRTWTPNKEKTNNIRLLQYPHAKDPFVELWFHYNVGNSFGFLCPRMNTGNECPVCEFAFELNKSGDKKDKATAKKLWPKQRFYAAMVDREDEKLEPKLWGFGKEIYAKLLNKLLGEDYKDLLNPWTGYDAEVRMEKRGDSDIPNPVLELRIKPSKLADSEEKVKRILDSIPKVEEAFKPLTTAEINEKLNAWLKISDQDGGEVTRGSVETSTTTQTETTTPTTQSQEEETNGPSLKDLDAAFEEALRD